MLHQQLRVRITLRVTSSETFFSGTEISRPADAGRIAEAKEIFSPWIALRRCFLETPDGAVPVLVTECQLAELADGFRLSLLSGFFKERPSFFFVDFCACPVHIAVAQRGDGIDIAGISSFLDPTEAFAGITVLRKPQKVHASDGSPGRDISLIPGGQVEIHRFS